MTVAVFEDPVARALLDAASNALALVDQAGRVVASNEAFRRDVESDGEVLFAASADARRALEDALLVAGGGISAPSSRWSATVSPIGQGGLSLVVARATPSPAADAPWPVLANAPSESEALSDAIDHLPIGVVLVEVDEEGRGKLVAHNRSFARLCGHPGKEISSSLPVGVCSRDGRVLAPHELPGVATAISGEPIRDVVVSLDGADGVTRAIQASATPVVTVDGVRRAVCVLLDVTSREEAEAARRASERRCAGFFAALHDASAVFERTEEGWVYREVNDALVRQVGRARAELLGARLEDLFPDVATRLVPVLDGALARDAHTLERETMRDGTDFLVRAFVSGPREVVVTALDITERKVLERALRASTERYEATAAAVPGALYDYVAPPNAPIRVVYVSPSAERIFERPIVELFAADGAIARAMVGATVEARDGRRIEREARIATKSGEKVLRFYWRAGRVDEDGTVRGSGVVLDATETAATRKALDRSRRELTNLVERLPVGVFLARGSIIVYANPELARSCGHARAEDLVGLSTSAIFEQGELATDDPFDRVREWSCRRPDGREVVLETSARRDVEFEGEAARLVAVNDLTELRAMRARLMQADRLASVGLLAAGVAHEVNNPLSFVVASIESMAEAMGSTAIDTELLAQGLADARVGAHRVRQVVRDLKTFSHARLDPERMAPIDVQSLLDSSSSMVASEVRHRARLVKDYRKVPLVVGNEARLGQVFLNLLVNAAHALPEGRVEANEIRIATSTTADGRACIEISDTGTGIPEAALERIFEPFFTSKPAGVGTGLGLAICRTTVDAMGGTISVENRPSGGALFRLVLPSHEGATDALARTLRPVRPLGKRGKVLVLDDESVIARSLGRMLGKEHDVVTSTDGREVLSRCRSGERFDVILCDLMMPEVTGMDVHAAIADLDADQAKRMVFLTGGAFTPRATEFLNRIENVWIDKPFDADTVRAIVRSLVGGG